MFSQFFVSALFAAFFPVQTFLCCSWECVLSFFPLCLPSRMFTCSISI